MILATGKLYRARSRLYRIQILQVNMRLKALAEIYTMHSLAAFGRFRPFLGKRRWSFCEQIFILQYLQHFAKFTGFVHFVIPLSVSQA